MEKEENILHGPSGIESKFQHLSLGKLLLNQLSVFGTNIAQVDAHTGREVTFQEVLEVSKKLAIALDKAGLKKNDRIAICSENNLEFCIPVCAAYYLGATLCPLNPLYSGRELLHTLNISKPKFIFMSSLPASTMLKIIDELPWMPKLIMLTESKDNKIPSIKTLISDVIIDNNFHACSVDVNEHVALISCSSGTTGLPKGVMLTDKNLLTVLDHMAYVSPEILNNHTASLALLPYFHVYAFATLLMRLVFGNMNIILSRFDEKVFLRAIEKYRVEILTLVPPLMVFLAKHPIVAKYDLSCVKEVWCGAAPLPEEIANAVEKRLNVVIKQGYGLTETTLAVVRTPSCGLKDDVKHRSVGTLAPGVSAKVIPIDADTSGEALGPYIEGELCFKGDLIMKGYCDDNKSTAMTIDKDGWLHSGDVGYYDENEYFYIVDRLKELIKYNGYQVPPAELEALLLACPGIKDAAVIGVPNEEAGELPLAFVVKQENSNITADDIIQYVNERVSSHKRLRGGVKFVHDIPKTPSGKILRRVLRDTLKSKL